MYPEINSHFIFGPVPVVTASIPKTSICSQELGIPHLHPIIPPTTNPMFYSGGLPHLRPMILLLVQGPFLGDSPAGSGQGLPIKVRIMDTPARSGQGVPHPNQYDGYTRVSLSRSVQGRIWLLLWCTPQPGQDAVPLPLPRLTPPSRDRTILFSTENVFQSNNFVTEYFR